MSEDIDGLVETSSNLGIIDNQDGRVKLTLSIRSSNDGERQKLSDTMRNICKDYGASLISHGEYPAWEYKKDSPLRETLSRVYYNMYKTEPRIEVIHAGLECGVFTNKIEGLDCISLGPDIFDIHTTDERLSIPSATRVWEFLKTALKEI